jgi:hypothetical protein
MAKYFVHENRYTGPGAREPFEGRQHDTMDVTIQSRRTRAQAEDLCARLNTAAKTCLKACKTGAKRLCQKRIRSRIASSSMPSA